MEATQNRTIIVAGATGLIGATLVRRLVDRGDRVIAFVRDPEGDRALVPGAAELVRWSASEREGAWEEALARADAVVNLAGAPINKRWTEEWKKVIADSRVGGTRNLIDAIERSPHRPEVFVCGSAVGYYGSTSEPVTEVSPPGDDFLANVCLRMEEEAMRGEELGMRVARVRTGLVLDKRDGALPKLVAPFRLFIGGPLGSGRQPFPWVHIDDEIGILTFALDNPAASGPLNAVAPQRITNLEFCETLGKVLGRPCWLPVPMAALRLLFGEGATFVVEGQSAVPERTLALGYRFRFSNAAEALGDLLH